LITVEQKWEKEIFIFSDQSSKTLLLNKTLTPHTSTLKLKLKWCWNSSSTIALKLVVRFSNICLNCSGYELCPFVSGPVFVFIWGGIYSKASTWEEKKSCCDLQFYISIYRRSFISFFFTTMNFIHMSIQYIPMRLEIKDTTDCFTTASYLDTLLKFDTNDNFMTNGTISISPSSTFITLCHKDETSVCR
jgi:hypothetical protein